MANHSMEFSMLGLAEEAKLDNLEEKTQIKEETKQTVYTCDAKSST